MTRSILLCCATALATFILPRPSPCAGVDIVVLTEFQDAWISNNADGSFDVPQRMGALGFQHNPSINSGTIEGDFTGDGLIDLLHQPPLNPDQVWLAENDGSGSFVPPAQIASGWERFPDVDVGQVITGDLNGDDALDVLIIVADTRSERAALYTAINDKNGVFLGLTLQEADLRADFPYPYFLFDFNGDGRDDLIEWSPLDIIYYERGLVEFGEGISAAQLPNQVPDGIGDFNGDGIADFYRLTPYGNTSAVAVTLGTGNVEEDGLFGDYQIWNAAIGFHNDPTRGNGWWTFAGDVNDDGNDDLIQLNEFGEIWVAYSNGIDGFSDPVKDAALGFHHQPQGPWQLFVGNAM